MHPFVAFLLFASSTSASSLVARNACPDAVWLTLVDGNNNFTGPSPLASGEAFLEAIEGQGNSLGVTREDSYWTVDTAKLILGTTTQDGNLYWSASTVDGDPFATDGISVTSPDGTGNNVCGTAAYGDGVVHGCRDGEFTLILDLCTR